MQTCVSESRMELVKTICEKFEYAYNDVYYVTLPCIQWRVTVGDLHGRWLTV